MAIAQHSAMTFKQLQYKFQSARRSRSDVETDNANIKHNEHTREEGEVRCTECERSKIKMDDTKL